jgi:uncharacterized protein (TIGR02246 family)
MADRMAIREVMTRYSRGIDRRDFDMVAGCFTADAEAEYSGNVLPKGVDAIVAYIRRIAHLPRSTHFMGDTLIDVDGDTADAETYAIAYLVDGEVGSGAQVHTRGLRYRDMLVRQDGRWLIHKRVHTADWMFSSPALPVLLERAGGTRA